MYYRPLRDYENTYDYEFLMTSLQSGICVLQDVELGNSDGPFSISLLPDKPEHS